jgi:hypothetical protein
MDDLRPKGTVEVKCSHPGCNTYWWIDPLDPRLPGGPFLCGSTHEDDRQKQIDSLLPIFGLRWGTRCYRGARSDGLPSVGGYGGEPAGTVLFHNKWWNKMGSLYYEDIASLDNPLKIPESINWDVVSPHLTGGMHEDPGPTPRMGGKNYVEQDDGSLKAVNLVVHTCTHCGRTVGLHETHPRAFSGPASCADETGWQENWNPCPTKDGIALALDDLLTAYHGKEAIWTMWTGGDMSARNAVNYYDQGAILIRKLVEPFPVFALLHYSSPYEILTLVKSLKFTRLVEIPMLASTPPEFSSRALTALSFV